MMVLPKTSFLQKIDGTLVVQAERKEVGEAREQARKEGSKVSPLHSLLGGVSPGRGGARGWGCSQLRGADYRR